LLIIENLKMAQNINPNIPPSSFISSSVLNSSTGDTPVKHSWNSSSISWIS